MRLVTLLTMPTTSPCRSVADHACADGQLGNDLETPVHNKTCGSWLQALLKRLQADTGIYGTTGEAPNHVLLNAYEPGQGILPHQVCCPDHANQDQSCSRGIGAFPSIYTLASGATAENKC